MTPELVRKLLDYDPNTGHFHWRERTSSKAPKGSRAGTVDRDGYIVIRHTGRGYKAHRLAWLYVHGAFPNGVIDHKNRVRDDNRIANLRDASPLVNANNISEESKSGRSGLRGVSWFSQYQKWKGSFIHRGRHYFVGHFDCKLAAYKAVVEKREAVQRGVVE